MTLETQPGTAPGTRTRDMALPQFSTDMADDELDKMVDNATTASNFLKAISHEGRLMILCHLVSGEKSVTELEELLAARQAAVSQQLSRLRLEGLVIPRREGKAIYYRLADERPRRILEVVYDLFCNND
ncbi:transcriptional regulator SoxR [Ruegeria pomeroyi DSS-3]|uniref:Transcriptional regulator SoxR n=2 Tax=Ruegeria pomeroyi TaxID=89184 RepID=Q5LUR4_RUEPO|nr:transcriptional regulator SoxR [Ruegeria pomeroyi DSS-3]